jgi:type II secretory pathway component PulF
MEHRRRLAQAVVWPLATLAVGMVVGLVALAIFSPLPSLIDSLAETVP